MEALLGFAFIAYMAAFCLKIITVWDADNGLYFHKGMAAAMVLYGIAAALCISKEQEPARGILLGVYFSYLITAAYEDYCTQLVHRFLHYLAAAAGLLYLLLYGRGIGSGLAVVLFALLQIGFGRRYFGAADAAAFAVSGLFFADGQRPGRILLLGLFHMLLSIVLVLLVKHRQIDFKKGSIEPTAFMPYIAAAALMLRYWMKYAGGM